MYPGLHDVLISRDAIQRRVHDLGAAISQECAGEELLVISILKGAAIFTADLIRSITVPICVEFVELASYDGTESTTEIRILKDIDVPVADKNLLVVEDIVDTGLTVSFLADRLMARGPRSLRVCALLSKPARRRTPVNIDYLGFSIPDEFVVGYGMDHHGHFRNLPDIRIWSGNV